MRYLISSLSLGLILSTSTASVSAQTLEIDGFAWAENLEFDGHGNLFVSDSLRGEVWRIYLYNGEYRQDLFMSGFEAVGGLAVTPDGLHMYACARTSSEYMIISFSTTRPFEWAMVAILPKSGNGLALHGDGLLYASTEGNFLPDEGEVYRVDPQTGEVHILMTDLWSSDGMDIDPVRNILYVGEVLTGWVWMYDLTSDQDLGRFRAMYGRKKQWLDDFVLSDDGSKIFGADFGRGDLVVFEVGTPDTLQVLAQGYTSPTSVDWGRGPGFHTTSLYLTEGGGMAETVTNRRVIEIPNMR